MAKSATISSKGQITLPKELRNKYHLTEGESAVVLDAGEGILIKHARSSLRGLLKGKIDIKGFEEDLKKLRKEWRVCPIWSLTRVDSLSILGVDSPPAPGKGFPSPRGGGICV